MYHYAIKLLLIAGLLLSISCTGKHSTTSNTNNPPPAKPAETAATTSRAGDVAKPPAAAGDLKVGQASGSYAVKGETVALKYAYAGHAERFGEDAVVILLTDQEIPADALADELKNQTMLLGGKIRGLEYAIMKDGYWVRYHPGQYQESKSPLPKDIAVENDIVKGSDEGDLSDGKYARSVKFVAAISKN